jgi:WD40 repeat protein
MYFTSVFIYSVVFASDNRRIISGSADKTVIIWNLQEKNAEAVLKGHRSSVVYIQVTKDNKYIISGSTDGTARIWDFEKYKKISF